MLHLLLYDTRDIMSFRRVHVLDATPHDSEVLCPGLSGKLFRIVYHVI